ncbi:MAG: YggT family protein [Candidatus Roizmanbacteria bacterium]|nr:YggT family protein [Candidatus Roizmanbacteria bacterium]
MTPQEEVTIVENQNPTHVVKKTIRQVEQRVKGEAPQVVYEKKKTILRSNQIIWYILGFIEVLLTFRLFLKMLGANQYVGFTSFIYSITAPLALPFSGVVGVSGTGSSILEWSTIIAGIVYLCIAWGLIYLLEIIYPITPSDLENE